MISIVPVRFMTNTDANSVWSEDVFKKWMQPLIPFSLGDFWWSSGKGLFPLDCTVYAIPLHTTSSILHKSMI